MTWFFSKFARSSVIKRHNVVSLLHVTSGTLTCPSEAVENIKKAHLSNFMSEYLGIMSISFIEMAFPDGSMFLITLINSSILSCR